MPGLYLAAVLGSMAGVAFLAARHLPGTLGPRLARTVVAVLLVFLTFDVVGAARGWFASSDEWVVAHVPPGIPLEEPLLLAFLALFAVVLLRLIARAVGEPDDASELVAAVDGDAVDA